jgi:hypothetical protein
MLQALQSAQLAAPQQRPSTQFPLVHSTRLAHTWPALFFKQKPPMQL